MTGVTSRLPPITVIGGIPGETGVLAVTSLGDHVYVVRDNGKEIEVYDAVTLTQRERSASFWNFRQCI